MRRGPALLLLAVLAAGCSGGGDKPVALPTLTATPSATPTVAPVPPQATARSAQGADAFVRYFFDEMNAAFTRSAPELIASLSNAECTTCSTYEQALSAARDKGHYLDKPTFVVKEVAAAPLQSLGTIVEVFVDIPERHVVDAQGKVLTTEPAAGRKHFQVAVKRTRSGWVVSGVRTAA